MAGSAGCNQYNAGYTLGPDAGAISISPAASTRMFCSEPAGVMEQEAEFLAALQSAARYRIEGAQLTPGARRRGAGGHLQRPRSLSTLSRRAAAPGRSPGPPVQVPAVGRAG